MEVFKLFGSILVDSSKAEDSISKTDKKAEGLGSRLGKGIKTAAKWGAAIGAAAIAAGGAMFGVASKAAEATDRIDKMSQKIGISRKGFQEWDFILSQSGTDIEKLQVGMKTMVQRMDESVKGTGRGSEAFNKLGLSVKDLNGNMKSQEQMFEETARALQEMPAGAEKSQLAFDLFGKAGLELMPMLNGAAGSIDEMKAKAEELGLVISDDAIDAGVQFTDAMDQLKRSMGAVGTNIGAALMPMFIALSDWIQSHMPEIQATIKAFVDGVKKLIDGFKVFWDKHGEAITAGLKKTWDTIKLVIETGLKVIKGIIDIVMGIIEGDWERVWMGIKGILEAVFNLIKHSLQNALDGLVVIIKGMANIFLNAGKALFQAVWDGMKGVWSSISSWVSDKVSWLADKLAFWKKSEQEMATSNSGGVHGSHAGGLAYVPFDGYKAMLHKGERVLTADENKVGYGSGSISNVFNIANMTVKDEEDYKKIAQELFNLQVRASRGRGLVTA